MPDNAVFNSYLLESTVRFRRRNYVWTRLENAERSNELILGEAAFASRFRRATDRMVQAYTLGYDRDFDLVPHLASAIGAQFTTYGVPDRLKFIYGEHPAGVAVFLRLRPFSAGEK